ncbi:hypothetical protein Tco_0824054 [Tanacetum coccineum]|uniref:Reverse transcriptase/retrotransposon-derived protein RNase H-like domain-containing protein n=1 Tax=Tanacetum coccineum TaxID=301880 RepID=A0ABQ5AJN1_9ASTR
MSMQRRLRTSRRRNDLEGRTLMVQDFHEVSFPEDFAGSSSNSTSGVSIVFGTAPSGRVSIEIDLRSSVISIWGSGSEGTFRRLPSELVMVITNFKLCQQARARKASEDNIGVVEERGVNIPSHDWIIKDWTSPKSPTEIRQFLGLAGYYRRFIEGFSKIAKPMTKLTHNAPILALPEGSRRIYAYCDASQKGLGAVLMHGVRSQDLETFVLWELNAISVTKVGTSCGGTLCRDGKKLGTVVLSIFADCVHARCPHNFNVLFSYGTQAKDASCARDRDRSELCRLEALNQWNSSRDKVLLHGLAWKGLYVLANGGR